jgi:hypothetical protein
MLLDKSLFEPVAAHLPLSQIYSYVIQCAQYGDVVGVRTVCQTDLLNPISVLIACLNGQSADCVKVAAYYCRDEQCPKTPIRMNFSDATVVDFLYRKLGMHVRCDNMASVLNDIEELQSTDDYTLWNICRCVYTILYEYRLKTGRSVRDVGVAHDSLGKISDLGKCNKRHLSLDRRFGMETNTDLALAASYGRTDVVENLLSRDYPDFGDWTSCPKTTYNSVYKIRNEFGLLTYRYLIIGGIDPNSLKISREWIPTELDLAYMIIFWNLDQTVLYEKYFAGEPVEIYPHASLHEKDLFRTPLQPTERRDIRDGSLIIMACLLCNSLDRVKKYLNMANIEQLSIAKICSKDFWKDVSSPFVDYLFSEGLIYIDPSSSLTSQLVSSSRYDIIEALNLDVTPDNTTESPEEKFLFSFSMNSDIISQLIEYDFDTIRNITSRLDLEEYTCSCTDQNPYDYGNMRPLCYVAKAKERISDVTGFQYSAYWKKIRMLTDLRCRPPFKYEMEWESYYILNDSL